MSNCNFVLISIEGNIGSGKSTLLENLRKYYSDTAHVIFLKEPVDDWDKIRDSEGNTMLKKFYSEQEKYSFAFQMMAYISRLKNLRDTIKYINTNNFSTTINENLKSSNINSHKYVIITERSLYTDKHVFAKMLYDQSKIEDVCYQIYMNWFEEFAKDFPINYSVYVKTDPIKCYERIYKRARVGEDIIPLSYLQDCHKYHEEFMNDNTGIKCEKIELNGNINIYENKEIIDQWIQHINKLVQHI